MASPMSKGAVKEKVSTHGEEAMVTSATGSAYLRRRKESWMRGQQMRPLYDVYQHVNSKLGRQHTWAPLAAAFHLLAYCTHPTNNVNDAWRLATPTGSTSPTIFEQWCGFFYVPQEPCKCKCCETQFTVFRPYPRRLESLTICRCHLQRQHFLLSYLKTLSVGPARVRTRYFPLSRPALSQLSYSGGANQTTVTYIRLSWTMPT